jgi:hypothetical protein
MQQKESVFKAKKREGVPTIDAKRLSVQMGQGEDHHYKHSHPETLAAQMTQGPTYAYKDEKGGHGWLQKKMNQ